MSFDYFDDLEDFGLPECDPDDPVATRESIIEVFNASNIEVPPSDVDEDALAESAPYVLFAFLYDYDMTMALYAIPAGELDAKLENAMKTADGRAYAHHELVVNDKFNEAFVRVEAAVGLDLIEEYFEHLPEPLADSDRDCLSSYRVATIEHEEEPSFEPGALDHRFVGAYSVQRAQ